MVVQKTPELEKQRNMTTECGSGNFTRRRFLSESAVVFCGVCAAPELVLRTGRAPARQGRSLLSPAENDTVVEGGPQIVFPTAPRERIAIASYPFRQFITSTEAGATPGAGAPPKMALKDFGAHVAEKFKINRVELWSPQFLSRESGYLAEMRAALDAAHVNVVNIAVDGEHSIYAADATERSRAIAESKSWIDVAVAIGSPSVRTHVAGAKDSGPNLERAAESLRQVIEYGAAKNIVVNPENDNPVSEDAFFIGRLVATVKSPWLHTLPDFANSLPAMSARQAYDAIDGMFAESYNICHVKALEVSEIGERFHVDMGKTFGVLKRHNFRGYCSMEFDSPGDPYGGTADLIKQTVGHLS